MLNEASSARHTESRSLSRREVLRATAGAMGLASGLCGGGTPPAIAQAKHKLKIGGVFPASAQASKTMQRFADLIGQKTRGQVEVSVFPGGQLGDEQQLLQTALAPGFQDLTTLSISILATADPKVSVTNLPFLWDDIAAVARYADGKGFEAHRDQLLQSKGLRMLGAWGYGFSILATKRPAETLAQLKGMKIRIPPSPTFTQIFRLLGANPTPVPFGELYTSLQTGVVEGWVASYDTNLASKFYNVVKYNNNARLHMGFTNPVIAEKFFQSLPMDIQKAMVDAGRETTVYNREEIEKAEAAAKIKLAELGMVNLEVKDRPEWRQALQPMYAEFEQKYGGELLRAVQGS